MRDKYLLHIINELLSVVDPYFNSITSYILLMRDKYILHIINELLNVVDH